MEHLSPLRLGLRCVGLGVLMLLLLIGSLLATALVLADPAFDVANPITRAETLTMAIETAEVSTLIALARDLVTR